MIHVTHQRSRCGTLTVTLSLWPVTTRTRNTAAQRTAAGGGMTIAGLLRDLIGTVCVRFGVSPALLMSEFRGAQAVKARAAIVWALRQRSVALSYQEIATALQRKDHGTALNLWRKARALRTKDAAFRTLTDELAALGNPA